MALITTGCLYFTTLLVACVALDYVHLAQGHAIDRRGHTRRAWWRAALAVPAWVLFTFVHVDGWALRGLATGGWLFFAFWTLFDGLLNALRGLGFFSAGSPAVPGDGSNDGFLDSFLLRFSVPQRAALKLGGLGVFLFWYLKTL